MDENILIIDDHPVVLDGLVLLLKSTFSIDQIHTALTAGEAIQIIKKFRNIDWIFVDVMLPDKSGIELLKEFKRLKTTANIVVLSSDSNPSIIDCALKSHANGYLSKSFKKDELDKCIHQIERGKVYLSHEHHHILQNYRNSVLKEKEHIEQKISSRQIETLMLMANGYSNQEIATSLNIVESTVKSHVHGLMTLFAADNRTHCVAEARRLHII